MSKKAIPESLRQAVFAAQDCCAACGTWDAWEADHVIPESRGGKTELSNLIRKCDVCNKYKNNAIVHFAEFAKYELNPEIITKRREYYRRYCQSARGRTKIKPYRQI